MQLLIDYSSAAEPLIFSRHLPASIPHVLVDLGAGDGMFPSLSRQFVDLGWQSFLIERDPKLFRDLEENCAGLSNVQCLPALSETVPREIGLLIVHSPTLDLKHLCPGAIVKRDEQDNQELLAESYQDLTDRGYKYSGLAGDYSMWCFGQVEAATVTCSEPPPDLPCTATGRASFDPLGMGGLISGWAFADTQSRVPSFVWIELFDRTTGVSEYVQAYRYFRPEIATQFKARNLLLSGFRAAVSLGPRPVKSLSLRVVQADSDTLYRADAELVFDPPLEDFEKSARAGLARKFLSGSGIEVGALQRPLPVPEGCRVRYIDRIPLEELLAHYPEVSNALQGPDLLDDGETLSRTATGSQDFVVANHFFEHSENPIQTLSNLLRVVRKGGILYMAVPDKRYTFDFHRTVTAYETLKETFETGLRPDRETLFRDWVTISERYQGEAAEARLAHLLETNYSIHYNIWSSEDLLTFVLKARADFNLPFRITAIVSCENEVIVLLERT